jgi:acyl-CoA hydrolase
VSQALPPIAQTYESFFEAVVAVADPKYQPSLQAAADQINGEIDEAVQAFPATQRRALGRVNRAARRA